MTKISFFNRILEGTVRQLHSLHLRAHQLRAVEYYYLQILVAYRKGDQESLRKVVATLETQDHDDSEWKIVMALAKVRLASLGGGFVPDVIAEMLERLQQKGTSTAVLNRWQGEAYYVAALNYGIGKDQPNHKKFFTLASHHLKEHGAIRKSLKAQRHMRSTRLKNQPAK